MIKSILPDALFLVTFQIYSNLMQPSSYWIEIIVTKLFEPEIKKNKLGLNFVENKYQKLLI